VFAGTKAFRAFANGSGSGMGVLSHVAPSDYGKNKKFGVSINQYISSTGDVFNLVLNRRWNDTTTSGYGSAGLFVVLDMSQITFRPLQTTVHLSDRQEPSQDGVEKEFLTEYSRSGDARQASRVRLRPDWLVAGSRHPAGPRAARGGTPPPGDTHSSCFSYPPENASAASSTAAPRNSSPARTRSRARWRTCRWLRCRTWWRTSAARTKARSTARNPLGAYEREFARRKFEHIRGDGNPEGAYRQARRVRRE
jgi:hypothetical protein